MMHVRDDAIRELLDCGPWDDAMLRRNLRDIRRINGLLGWRAAVVRGVAREVRTVRRDQFSLLDVASGSADIPAAVACWAARAGIPARIVASDLDPQIVAVAAAECAGAPGLSVARQDALGLGYPAASFDFALCTLALHHFAPDDAVRLLRELARVGRRVLVYDVQRARLAYLGVIALTRLLRMDPMTCHDAPATVRRAYSAGELRALAARAGLRNARVRVRAPYRLVLTADGEGDGERGVRGGFAEFAEGREGGTAEDAEDAEDAEKRGGIEYREGREGDAKHAKETGERGTGEDTEDTGDTEDTEGEIGEPSGASARHSARETMHRDAASFSPSTSAVALSSHSSVPSIASVVKLSPSARSAVLCVLCAPSLSSASRASRLLRVPRHPEERGP